MNKEKPWQILSRETSVHSKWVKVYKDQVLDDEGNELEYWHVDRSDSVIVLVRQGEKFLLPAPQWRPGVERRTLDFPGGRIEGADPEVAAQKVIRRELKIDSHVKLRLKALTVQPLFVDSSFSSQKLYGYIVEIPSSLLVDAQKFTELELLDQLQCLQCRALLLEAVHRNY